MGYYFVFILFSISITPCFPSPIDHDTNDLNYILLPQTILTPFTPLRIAVMAESSPSSNLTHQFDFSVIDLKRNSEISARTVTIPRNSTYREDVSLPISSVNYNPHTLRIQLLSFSSVPNNHTGFYDISLVNETYVNLTADLRRTDISILTSAFNPLPKEGDTIPFTILFLDSALKPFPEKRSANVYLWSYSSDNQYNLRKNWTSVNIAPGKPYLSGLFQIPQNETSRETTEFILSAIVDERMPEDAQNLQLPVSMLDIKALDSSHSSFFSSAFKKIQMRNERQVSQSEKVPLLVQASLNHEAVSYASPHEILKIKTTNMYGHPVMNGECSIELNLEDKRYYDYCDLTLITNNLPLQLHYSGKEASTFHITFSSNCSSNDLFKTSEVRVFSLHIKCIDKLTLQEGTDIVNRLRLSRYEYMLPYLVAPTDESSNNNNNRKTYLIIQVLTKEGYAYTSNNSTDPGDQLRIHYIFHDNSSFVSAEPVGYNGIVEHKILHKNESSKPLVKMIFSFKNSTKEVEDLYNPPEVRNRIFQQNKLFGVGKPLPIPFESTIILESGQDMEFMFIANHSMFKYITIFSVGEISDTEILFLDLTPEASSTRNVKFFSFRFPPIKHRSKEIRIMISNSSILDVSNKDKFREIDALYKPFIYNGSLETTQDLKIETELVFTELKMSVPITTNSLQAIGIHSISLLDHEGYDYDLKRFLSFKRGHAERCMINNFAAKTQLSTKCSNDIQAVLRKSQTADNFTVDKQTLFDDNINATLHELNDQSAETPEPNQMNSLTMWKWNRTSHTTDTVDFNYKIPITGDDKVATFTGIVIDSNKGLGFLNNTVVSIPDDPVMLYTRTVIHDYQNATYAEVTLINYSEIAFANVSLNITDLSKNVLFSLSNATSVLAHLNIGPYSYVKAMHPFTVIRCNEESHIQIQTKVVMEPEESEQSFSSRKRKNQVVHFMRPCM